MEMDTTPSDLETTTLTDTIEISSNIDVHPIMRRDQSLPRLVEEVRSFTESLIGAIQPYISSDQTHMSINDDSAST
jgi:hypothetical protein